MEVNPFNAISDVRLSDSLNAEARVIALLEGFDIGLGVKSQGSALQVSPENGL